MERSTLRAKSVMWCQSPRWNCASWFADHLPPVLSCLPPPPAVPFSVECKLLISTQSRLHWQNLTLFLHVSDRSTSSSVFCCLFTLNCVLTESSPGFSSFCWIMTHQSFCALSCSTQWRASETCLWCAGCFSKPHKYHLRHDYHVMLIKQSTMYV